MPSTADAGGEKSFFGQFWGEKMVRRVTKKREKIIRKTRHQAPTPPPKNHHLGID